MVGLPIRNAMMAAVETACKNLQDMQVPLASLPAQHDETFAHPSHATLDSAKSAL